MRESARAPVTQVTTDMTSGNHDVHQSPTSQRIECRRGLQIEDQLSKSRQPVVRAESRSSIETVNFIQQQSGDDRKKSY